MRFRPEFDVVPWRDHDIHSVPMISSGCALGGPNPKDGARSGAKLRWKERNLVPDVADARSFAYGTLSTGMTKSAFEREESFNLSGTRKRGWRANQAMIIQTPCPGCGRHSLQARFMFASQAPKTFRPAKRCSSRSTGPHHSNPHYTARYTGGTRRGARIYAQTHEATTKIYAGSLASPF